jgi:hypothetical protein
VVERITIAKLCVDTALLLALLWRDGRGRHEQIHLITRLSLLMHAEDDGQRMAERDRREAGQQLRVLRFIPISCELIWRPDNDGIALESQRLRWLQPGPKRLFRKLVPRSVEDTRPDFGRRERHGDVDNSGRRGSEAIRAMWKKQTTVETNGTTPPSTAASLGLTYLLAEANFTRLCRS